MKKTCPKCGREFVCKHDSTCFCMKYTISKDDLRTIKAKYLDCLCEECLKKYKYTTKQ